MYLRVPTVLLRTKMPVLYKNIEWKNIDITSIFYSVNTNKHVLKLSEIFYLEKIPRNCTFISNIVHKVLKMHFIMLIGYI